LRAGNYNCQSMEMTLNISAEVLRAVERRANQERRSIDESVEDLLRERLRDELSPEEILPAAVVETDLDTGLPIIRGTPNAPISKMFTREIVDLIHRAEEEAELDRYFACLRR
jgi:hypothetical protein